MEMRQCYSSLQYSNLHLCRNKMKKLVSAKPINSKTVQNLKCRNHKDVKIGVWAATT